MQLLFIKKHLFDGLISNHLCDAQFGDFPASYCRDTPKLYTATFFKCFDILFINSKAENGIRSWYRKTLKNMISSVLACFSLDERWRTRKTMSMHSI